MLLADQVPHLYRVDKATGVEADAGRAGAFALDGSVVWVMFGVVIRVEGDNAVVWAEPEQPNSFTQIAVADHFVAALDDAGRLWSYPKEGDPDPHVVDERQFATNFLRAHGDTLVWLNGEDIHLWRPEMASSQLLPRLSDGQQGLIVRDAVVGDDVVWLILENRSEQRPGGVMRLRSGETAWVMHMRSSPFQAHLFDDFLYLNDTTGFLRVPAF